MDQSILTEYLKMARRFTRVLPSRVQWEFHCGVIEENRETPHLAAASFCAINRFVFETRLDGEVPGIRFGPRIEFNKLKRALSPYFMRQAETPYML